MSDNCPHAEDEDLTTDYSIP